ncbi:MAG: hypothetical protein GY842_16185 [bacterium]|nr:hypothetical protein [bacterium]
MRASGAILLVLLFVAAAIMFMEGRQAEDAIEAVTEVAVGLEESGVVALSFDQNQARRYLAEMQALISSPKTIAGQVDQLRKIGETAASWVKGAGAAGRDVRIAVALRGAAGALRQYVVSPSKLHLSKASKRLEDARLALSSAQNIHINSPTGLVHDKLDNLQQGHQEKLQQMDEALSQ